MQPEQVLQELDAAFRAVPVSLYNDPPPLQSGRCAADRAPRPKQWVVVIERIELLCCEDARLSPGPCSCADLVELMHAPARPPRRVRNPSSQQSNRE